MGKNKWADEKRTAIQFVKDADADDGNVTAMARRLKTGPKHLWTWLTTPGKGVGRVFRLTLRDGLGLPTVAILERDRPIGEVVKEERERTR